MVDCERLQMRYLISSKLVATALLMLRLLLCLRALLCLQMNYNNKNMLMGALLVAGFDKHSGGQVCCCGVLPQQSALSSHSSSQQQWQVLFKSACVCMRPPRQSHRDSTAALV